ncbi:Oidioi.mRNA.OKI2018_I69.XSR.g16034.t1.cds [Oikopleura dioica]|uniref:Oidioi.mRNA.OKI2018_I69.XSR.g16034.t1.cds n=1 Tax=Oikopleura dioica TaxID=34765 RepID=A0ABN7SFA4_OIKDI|nr:Oidioi.mRNA.OKI2018_I69.XSR.g16034.t1.cds [Oikopleura dioica]
MFGNTRRRSIHTKNILIRSRSLTFSIIAHLACIDKNICPTNSIIGMDDPEIDNGEVDNTVGKNLSLATVEKSTDRRFELLDSVIESLEKNENAVLDNFQDEICNFTKDKNPSIRAQVIRFITLSVKREKDTIVALLPPLNSLLSDECSNVLCRTLISLCYTLPVFAEGNAQMPIRETLVEIYETVVRLLEDENDGIRTQAVRVVEEFILFKNESFSIFENAILTLTDFLKKATISNGNLVAGLTSLSRIAKTERDYVSTVISEFENLNASLPPTLSITQVKNVRKLIRIQLIDIMKSCPETREHEAIISTLLRDLGMGKAEVDRTMKLMAVEDKRKATDISMDDDRDPDEEVGRPVKRNRADQEREQIEELADELYDGLCEINDVVDLVILSLPGVPEKMQPSFSSTYTPITSAGSSKQKMSIARLLANQITQAGLGKRQDLLHSPKKRRKNSDDSEPTKRKFEPMEALKAMDKDLESSTGAGRNEFHLANVTKSLAPDVKFRMVKMAVDDMIKGLVHSNHNSTLHGMLTKIVAHFSGSFPALVADVIEHNPNPRNRIEMSLSWLYAEYEKYLDIRESPSDMQALENYNVCIGILLTVLKEKNADAMFEQLLFQAPILTEDTFGILMQFCVDGECPDSSEALISTLGKLAIQRPVNRMRLLELLLQLSTHWFRQIRIRALDQIVTIYERFQDNPDVIQHITIHIVKSLGYLIYEEPPQTLSDIASDWTEDLIERCLDLAVAVLPFDADVLLNLCDIFNRTPSMAVKRVISRAMEAPVRRIPQTNVTFLDLVKNMPEGCESLVTRILHIVTKNGIVEQELIDAIKHVMSTDRRDIRFMIPILQVLPKEEVVEALPELIQLQKKVVKDVFFRLLGVHSGSQSTEGDQHVAPLTATELLVELHLMEGASVKPAIEAIALCLAEKTVFTLEVFASAISRMLKFDQLPALFMRTVLQALITHPRITSEIIVTLKTLITREIWHTQKLWDGFVICCQKLKTRCVMVLLKLPKEPLDKILATAPDLKAYLVSYLESIEPTERLKIGEHFQNISMITAS